MNTEKKEGAAGMPQIDLQAFCSKRAICQTLMKPWTAGAYTYATCGRNIVRVPARPDVPVPTDYLPPNTEPLAWPIGPVPTVALVMPTTWPERKLEKCCACEGKGHFRTCNRCDGEGCYDCDEEGFFAADSGKQCTNCGGTGECQEPLRIQIGKARFDFDIIRNVLELPELRIVPSGPVDKDIVFDIGFATESEVAD